MAKIPLHLPGQIPKTTYCMTIGILKEIDGENRVSMLPESVATLVKMNVALLVETSAGLAAYASDAEYELAGARIETKAKVIAGADVLIKIQPPTTEEIDQMKDGQVIMAVLNP
jgi:NAD(P) transhydrogenase subunit alpha